MSVIEAVKTSFARPDWRERLMDGRSLLPDLPADLLTDTADRAVEIWGGLKIPYVGGAPTFRDAGAPWFKDFLRAMFLMDGPRRVVREAFVMTPKKAGLTTNCAALMLTGLILNERPSAKFALIGPTMEISEILFESMALMIAADDELSKIFAVRKHIREIENRLTGAKAVVKALNVSALTGARLNGAIICNLQFLRHDRFAATMRELRGALCGSDDAFLIMAATQTAEPPAGVFLKELTRARATRDGDVDGGVLPLIYEPPADIDWRDPANLPLLHPGIGRTVSAEFLRREMEEADRQGYLSDWAAQWLNVQAGAQE